MPAATAQDIVFICRHVPQDVAEEHHLAVRLTVPGDWSRKSHHAVVELFVDTYAERRPNSPPLSSGRCQLRRADGALIQGKSVASAVRETSGDIRVEVVAALPPPPAQRAAADHDCGPVGVAHWEGARADWRRPTAEGAEQAERRKAHRLHRDASGDDIIDAVFSTDGRNAPALQADGRLPGVLPCAVTLSVMVDLLFDQWEEDGLIANPIGSRAK